MSYHTLQSNNLLTLNAHDNTKNRRTNDLLEAPNGVSGYTVVKCIYRIRSYL